MKTLTLLRHAKSEQDRRGADFERSLNDRGRADARRMGNAIRDLGLSYDLVVASPASRVVETVMEVGGLSPAFDQRIYDAAMTDLLGIVAEIDDSLVGVMLVGHNPGMERLAAWLTDDAVETMPTAALVEIELAGERWRDAGMGSGRLVRILKPKDLA